MFRSDAGIIETCAYRFSFVDLAFGVLQQIGLCAVEDAYFSGNERRSVFSGAYSFPPASTPINLTSLSFIKPEKMPMALLPPPTQATTISGNLPICSRHC